MKCLKVISVLIIINKILPEKAKKRLSEFGSLIEVDTKNIVDDYLSGHPDVFFTLINNRLIYSPSLPANIITQLETNGVRLTQGKSFLKNTYPECAAYNAVVTKDLIIHKTDITDIIIKENCSFHKFINVNQGMTRCSLIPITDNAFITSDKGIFRTLKSEGYDTLLVGTEGIILPGKSYGLFGGTCGVYGKDLFLTGKLKYFGSGRLVSDFCNKHSINIIELYDGPLFDGGSILFV